MSVKVIEPAAGSGAEQAPVQKPERLRLDFLDGLRGLAALYVMFGHAFALSTFDGGSVSHEFSPLFVRLTQGLQYAHFAVGVFIVLSGFCLMLPVARSQSRSLQGGLTGFFARRARRILPPYYAALAFVVGILLLSHHFVKHAREGMADLSAGCVLSHVFLVHNLFEKYSEALDKPMWSVGWEWQIYFLFALILLPIWRRTGAGFTVAAGFTLGFLPIVVLPRQDNLSWMNPWYVGLFALGMAAAVVSSTEEYQDWRARTAAIRNVLLSVMALGFVALVNLAPGWLDLKYYWISDPAIGLTTSLLILACADRSAGAPLVPGITRGLESRAAMWLGAVSYSLYLVHYPVLKKMRDVLDQHHVSRHGDIAAIFLIGIPLSLGLTYIFHRIFERPFMSGRSKAPRLNS